MRTMNDEKKVEILVRFSENFTKFYENDVKTSDYLNNYVELTNFLRAYFDKRFFNQMFTFSTKGDQVLVEEENHYKLLEATKKTKTVYATFQHEEVLEDNQTILITRADKHQPVEYKVTLTR